MSRWFCGARRGARDFRTCWQLSSAGGRLDERMMGKGTLCRELIERACAPERFGARRRGGSTEVRYEESQPTGGKRTLRPHVIEAGGSHEVWYGGSYEKHDHSIGCSFFGWHGCCAGS
ncbi:MAG: hypothetical protein ACRENW_09535 [Thermodesulfobacteriota bacterium]